jgi:hypothetical protein
MCAANFGVSDSAAAAAPATATGAGNPAHRRLLCGGVGRERRQKLGQLLGTAVGTARGVAVSHELLETRFAFHTDELVDWQLGGV